MTMRTRKRSLRRPRVPEVRKTGSHTVYVKSEGSAAKPVAVEVEHFTIKLPAPYYIRRGDR